MGTWNLTCSISHLPICQNDSIVINIIKHPYNRPMFLPITGLYKGYGRVQPYTDLENRSNVITIQIIQMWIGDTNIGIFELFEILAKEPSDRPVELQDITVSVIHKKIWDDINKLALHNPRSISLLAQAKEHSNEKFIECEENFGMLDEIAKPKYVQHIMKDNEAILIDWLSLEKVNSFIHRTRRNWQVLAPETGQEYWNYHMQCNYIINEFILTKQDENLELLSQDW